MLNRRSFMLAAAAGLATAGTWAGGTTASAAAPSASAGLTDPFDLNVASKEYIREKRLFNNTILQSFAFDDVHLCIYAVQLMEGGIQLPGEPGVVSGTERSARGDMCLTKLSLSGSVLGHMYLRGFGHGASMGVEPEGDTSYIWTEADANPETGYGRAVARFPFSNGQVLDSSLADKIYVMPGSTSNRPAIDVSSGRLVVQYMLDEGNYRYRVLDLDQAKSGDLSPTYDLPRIGIADTETPQGLAVLGDYLYQMTGTHYTSESGDNPPSGRGDTYLTTVHMPTQQVVQRSKTEAGYSLNYREPEGLAIRLGVSPAQLHMGFASGVSGDRLYSFFYKPHPDQGSVTWPTVSPGAQGTDVYTIQFLLTHHGFATTADGIFGPATEASVKSFQQANGLSPTGSVSPDSWPDLIATVRQGDTNKAVSGVQHQLNKHGAALTVDGQFGSLTYNAVVDFQSGHGLTVDGVVAPTTWLYLTGTA